jgi:hypothetical protein
LTAEDYQAFPERDDAFFLNANEHEESVPPLMSKSPLQKVTRWPLEILCFDNYIFIKRLLHFEDRFNHRSLF